MSDLFSSNDPTLSRMVSADAAMIRAREGVMNKKLENIKETAGDFEAMFISEMLGNMFQSVGTDPLFGGGEAEETWKSLMIDEYGKQISRSGGIGLSDAIMSKMIEMQGVEQ